MSIIELSVYGDNILECERMFDLIYKGFGIVKEEETDLSHIYSPRRIIKNDENQLVVQLYPDYKSKTRWHKEGLLHILVENGANLTEAPDVILTRKEGDKEIILLAIEFSSALPAGNQAWQRSGRALSFSEVGIPYLYINDIGLEELSANRESKAERSSNPLVPLSYIKHTQRTSSFTLSVLNPSQLIKLNEINKNYLVDLEVINLISNLIYGRSIDKEVECLNNKTENYINSFLKTPKNVDFKKWINLDDKDIEELIMSFDLPSYKKKVAEKTPIKEEMKILIREIIPLSAISIYNDLPICFVPSAERKTLKNNILNKCYPLFSEDVIKWLDGDGPIVICLINGFKPRGDDARPDRGLVPFGRMLFGFNIDLLAIVFGQASKEMGDLFKKDAVLLAEKNGLWKSILYYSSLTIADSHHWNNTDPDKTRFGLKAKGVGKIGGIQLTRPERIPIKFNENDVDTAIHLTFHGKQGVFEGLCNPPGGDWSGISLIDTNLKEHRWMSLPRVSVDAKRPDHIFQITHKADNFILIIESKEKLSGLLFDKVDLGVGLLKYVQDLVVYSSSAIRTDGKWERNNNKTIFQQNFKDQYTAAAFIYSSDAELNKAKDNLKVDLIIGFDTNKKMLETKPVNRKGLELQMMLKELGIN